MRIRSVAAGNDPVHIPEAFHGGPVAGVGDFGSVVPRGPAPHVLVGRRVAGAQRSRHGRRYNRDVRCAARVVPVLC